MKTYSETTLCIPSYQQETFFQLILFSVFWEQDLVLTLYKKVRKKIFKQITESIQLIIFKICINKPMNVPVNAVKTMDIIIKNNLVFI